MQECMVLYFHPQYIFVAWCLVQHRDNFTCHENMFGGVEIQLHTLTSALATLPSGKEPLMPIPTGQEAGWAAEPVWT